MGQKKRMGSKYGNAGANVEQNDLLEETILQVVLQKVADAIDMII